VNQAEIAILVKLRDEASAGLTKIQKLSNSVGKTMGTALKFGALGAAGGIAAASFAIAGFVKKAAQEQVGIQKLQTAIKTLDAAHMGNAAAVEQVVREREKLAFADDDLRDSLSLLIVQTGDYEEAVRRQRIAMDLARGTGLDLELASKLVGKVTEENVEVLKRYGITIGEGATETEALAEIQRRFSGQAEAFAETATGKWQIFNNQIDNIKESIGSALLPTVTRLGDALGTFLTDHQADIDRFAVAMAEKIPEGINAIVTAIEPHLPALKSFGEDVLKGWQDILTTLQPKLDDLGKWLVEHQPVLFVVAAGAAAVLTVLLGWPAALAGAAVGAGLLATKVSELRQENEDLDTTLGFLEKGIGPLSVAIDRLAQFSMLNWQIVLAGIAYTINEFNTKWFTDFQREIGFVRGAVDLAKDTFYFFKDAIYSVRDAIYALRDAINSLPDVGNILPDLPSVPNPFNSLPGPLRRASGGPASGLTWVGEQGPELLYLPGGSRVYSNEQSNAMAGNTANVTLNIFGDVPEAQAQRHYRQLAQQLKEELEMETVSGQRLPIGVYSSR
jgi:hypothetical protein